MHARKKDDEASNDSELKKKELYCSEEEIAALLKKNPYSPTEISIAIKRSRYKDEIQSGIATLRKAGILTKDNQEAVILAFKNANKMAEAIERLDSHGILIKENRDAVAEAGVYADKVVNALIELNKHKFLPAGDIGNKNRAVVIEAGQYAEYAVEKLLAYQKNGNLTDETRAAVLKEIETEEEQAKLVFDRFKNAMTTDSYYDVVELADECVKFKPFSYQFLKSLSNFDRFTFIGNLLLATKKTLNEED